MILRPIETESEFLACGRERYKNSDKRFTGPIKKNISNARDDQEFDAYDLDSFHFGSFLEDELHACSRIVNDTKGATKFQLDTKSIEIIKSLSKSRPPKNGLALQDFVEGVEFDEVEKFFMLLRNREKKFGEIGRLIRRVNEGEKYLVNYMICYAWAFCRFYEVDYCFFEAIESHCKYYERFFHCKHVLQQIEFFPILGGEPYYLMQATMIDLPEKMNAIVNQMVEKFTESGGPCAIKINELR